MELIINELIINRNPMLEPRDLIEFLKWNGIINEWIINKKNYFWKDSNWCWTGNGLENLNLGKQQPYFVKKKITFRNLYHILGWGGGQDHGLLSLPARPDLAIGKGSLVGLFGQSIPPTCPDQTQLEEEGRITWSVYPSPPLRLDL